MRNDVHTILRFCILMQIVTMFNFLDVWYVFVYQRRYRFLNIKGNFAWVSIKYCWHNSIYMDSFFASLRCLTFSHMNNKLKTSLCVECQTKFSIRHPRQRRPQHMQKLYTNIRCGLHCWIRKSDLTNSCNNRTVVPYLLVWC